MALGPKHIDIAISDQEIDQAFCYSKNAMGNGKIKDIADIVFVDINTFDPARTVEIAAEISGVNKLLKHRNRKYLLIGPGRWGSADRWLGIPVSWNDISGVGAIIETTSDKLQAEPSQGTHFFHNLTSLGIGYITLSESDKDFIDWPWLQSLPSARETAFLKHIRLDAPLAIKIDGKGSRAVLYHTRQ